MGQNARIEKSTEQRKRFKVSSISRWVKVVSIIYGILFLWWILSSTKEDGSQFTLEYHRQHFFDPPTLRTHVIVTPDRTTRTAIISWDKISRPNDRQSASVRACQCRPAAHNNDHNKNNKSKNNNNSNYAHADTSNCTNELSPSTIEILNRDASRIPTYIDECSNTYFGYVFRDLLNRWYPAMKLPFSPNREKTTIIVSDAAERRSKRFKSVYQDMTETEAHQRFGYHLASSLYVSIRKRGYSVVAMSTRDGNRKKWQKVATTPSILAFFDPSDISRQDTLVTEYASALNHHHGSVDYLVFRVQISATSFNGKDAAIHLLQTGYRLQILSASHSFRIDTALSAYGPNTELRRHIDLEDYFEYGKRVVQRTNQEYQAYLFATKSLDMAIPSAKRHINLKKFDTPDVILNVDADAIPYRRCTKSMATVSWVNLNVTNSSHVVNESGIASEVLTNCVSGTVPEPLWFSGTSLETSDLVCLECRPEGKAPSMFYKPWETRTCTVRYIPDRENTESKPNVTRRRPNLLFVLLEQVSLARFKKIMPLTKEVLTKNEFTSFDRYTASSFARDYPSLFWTEARSERLEANLASANYRVFSGASVCNASFVVPSNRGSKFNEMICQRRPSRPNCIGSTPAAVHLLDYTHDFLVHHSKGHQPWASFLTFAEGQEDTGILTKMIDGELSEFLDGLRDILHPDGWDNTMIVVTSDTGSRRGSFSQTFDGQKEMIHPLLYVKSAKISGSRILEDNQNRFVTEEDVLATLEVVVSGEDERHGLAHSLTSVLLDDRNVCTMLHKSRSVLCDSSHNEQSQVLEKEISIGSHPPPSVLSFYSDVPVSGRKHLDVAMREGIPKRAIVKQGCLCATNLARWYACNEHPWSTVSPTYEKEHFMLVDCPGEATHLELRIPRDTVFELHANKFVEATDSGVIRPNVIFLEIDSVSGSYADRHFPKTREFLKRYRVHPTENGTYQCHNGLCSADFTQRITLAGANSIPNQVASLSGCLSSDFDHLCGLNETILENNQYCNDPDEPHFGLQIQRIRFAARHVYWCPPQPGVLERVTPWVYGITHSFGYANFFGEEFCYEGSPYVTQQNVYPAFFFHITPHSVFCRLAEQRIRRDNVTVPDQHRWGYERHDQICVDSESDDCIFEKSKISLDMIQQMWNVYSNRPKFAFLNVLAAHVYDNDWSQLFLMAERYDEHLSNFLEQMTQREDFKNTLIIVRSDHGLQKGPMAMDYNLQVEHTRPWTEILVPESFPSLSKRAFFENQNRLVSGHDLYHTIRSVIDPSSTSTSASNLMGWYKRLRSLRQPSKTTPLGDWSYDLLSTVVPEERTCRDARVDEQLCRERSVHPSFGICNVLDSKQIKFCRNYDVMPRINPKDIPQPVMVKKKTVVPPGKTHPVGGHRGTLSAELRNKTAMLKELMMKHGRANHEHSPDK